MDGHVKKLGAGSFGPLGGVLAALPPFPGKHRFIDCAAALSRWTGAAQTESSPWPGTRFSVDLRDRIQRQMWCGCYEPHVTRGLQAVLRSGDTFLDLGANIGYHSFFAARFVGSAGRVFAFEADPGVYRQLQRNLQQFRQAQVLHCAVCDHDGEAMFERSSAPGESGWGTLTAVRDLGSGEHVSVPAISLDHWAQQNPISSLRTIKMDIEGSEPAVLRGGRRLLEQFRPVLLLEINDVQLRNSKSSAELLGSELLGLRYHIYQLSYRRIVRINSLAGCSFVDCMCVPEESAPEIMKLLRKHGFRT